MWNFGTCGTLEQKGSGILDGPVEHGTRGRVRGGAEAQLPGAALGLQDCIVSERISVAFPPAVANMLLLSALTAATA